jgi:hypothetical protein
MLLRGALLLLCPLFLVAQVCLAQTVQQAQPADSETWNAKFQSTFISQIKPSLNSPYAGQNSLSGMKEKSYSLTATAYLGLRLGGDSSKSTELYFNSEAVQGVPLSNLTGLGGIANGELQKIAGDQLSVYRPRVFVRQTWGLGGERDTVASGQNQLAGSRDKNRLVLTAGNFSVTDIFDQNSYAHDARTQFLNWSFLTHGAYDYAADARGYTWGVALEYIQSDWAIRGGRFLEPRTSNSLPLNWNIFKSYGDQIEYERSYAVGEQAGKWRALAFRNVAVMGNFTDALNQAAGTVVVPNFDTTRRSQSKVGIGLSAEQTLSNNMGGFVRASAHDGKTETFSFTEIDRSLSMGIVLSGGGWTRPGDKLGVAWAINGLSGAHRAYAAAGGMGFFIGDGKLPNYKSETIAETYYLWQLGKQQLSVNAQFIKNPAYNADRGPVRVLGVRWHAEF